MSAMMDTGEDRDSVNRSSDIRKLFSVTLGTKCEH
jgi:hypothetical protein